MRTLHNKSLTVRILLSIFICVIGIYLEANLQNHIPGRFITIYPFLIFILYIAGVIPGLVSIVFYALISTYIPYAIAPFGKHPVEMRLIIFCISTFVIALIFEHKRKLEKRLMSQAIELERALKTRDEFLSIASHELKTPLTSLMLHSQYFMKGIEQGDPNIYTPQRVDALARQLEKQVTKLNSLVDDMLDISRISTGRLEIRPEEFDFSELINDIKEMLKTPFETSNYPLPIIESNHENVMVKWDRVRMEQVLINLFTNAIRNGEGKPIILNTSVADDKIFITIKDHGVGISEEDVNKIFDCYAKIKNPSQVNGLGLGLYISKQIVEAHQGQLTVESKLGHGSSFKIELPR